MTKWVPTKYGFSTSHIVIPVLVLFIGTLLALYTFSSGRRFSQLQKVFCFTNCFFLIVTMAYSAKYIGTFRSSKDIVEKSLLDKKGDYALLSYDKIEPSLVFYSGKNVIEVEKNGSLETLIPDKKEAYVLMDLNDYKKKKDWVQKSALHAVCENNAHVMLKKENN